MEIPKIDALSINNSPELGLKSRVEKVVDKIGVSNLKEDSATKKMYVAYTGWEEGLALAQAGRAWPAIIKLFNAVITDYRACTLYYGNEKARPHCISDLSSTPTKRNSRDCIMETLDKAGEVLDRDFGSNNAEKEINSNELSQNQVDWLQHSFAVIHLTLEGFTMGHIDSFVYLEQALKLALETGERWKKDSIPSFPPHLAFLEAAKSVVEDRVILTILELCTKVKLDLAKGANPKTEPKKRDFHLVEGFDLAQMAMDYDPNHAPGLLQMAYYRWVKCGRRDSMALFKKVTEIAPIDDTINAEARFMYAFGTCCGFTDIKLPLTAGKVRELWEWAKSAERQSEPLFEKVTCEGKTRLKEVMKALKKHKPDDDVIVKLECKTKRMENRINLKLSIGGQPVNLIEAAPIPQKVNEAPRPICLNCNAPQQDLKVCVGCKKVWYCSPACQKANWKAHKPNCLPKQLDGRIPR